MNFVEEFKKRCRDLDRQAEPMHEVEKVVSQVIQEPLFNIVKRSTDGKINKVVAIGFTWEQAQEWLHRKALKAKEVGPAIYFYDVVDQEKREQMDPLWNPRPFIQEVL